MSTPTDPQPDGRKQRKLNQPLIKSVIVLIVAFFYAILSGITGIGVQVFFAPSLTWMFGYRHEKAFATALQFALFVSAVTFLIGVRFVGNWEVFGIRGLLLVIGATIGATLTLKLSPSTDNLVRRRFFHTLISLMMLFVFYEGIRFSPQNAIKSHYAQFSVWWEILLIGGVTGALTRIMGAAGGVFMVPALFFLTAVPSADSVSNLRNTTAAEAVLVSHLVVFLASLLPSFSYSQRGAVDKTYLNWAIAGGILGGIVSGILLVNLLEKAILISFSIVAMFLSAQQLQRFAMETPTATKPPES